MFRAIDQNLDGCISKDEFFNFFSPTDDQYKNLIMNRQSIHEDVRIPMSINALRINEGSY